MLRRDAGTVTQKRCSGRRERFPPMQGTWPANPSSGRDHEPTTATGTSPTANLTRPQQQDLHEESEGGSMGLAPAVAPAPAPLTHLAGETEPSSPGGLVVRLGTE